MRFAEELSGRYREDRRALPALAISDPGYLSCVAKSQTSLGGRQHNARRGFRISSRKVSISI
jgi:phosphoheptose isomerase